MAPAPGGGGGKGGQPGKGGMPKGGMRKGGTGKGAMPEGGAPGKVGTLPKAGAAGKGAMPKGGLAPKAAAAAGIPQPNSLLVLPGEGSRPMAIATGPHTPPGSYRVELHVTEVVALTVMPSPLVVENRPGTAVSRRAVLANEGNVPLSIEAIPPVVLDEEFFQCRVLRSVVAEGPATVDEYVARLVERAGALLGQTGFLRVRVAGSPFVLAPGEARAVELRIRVPDGLDPHARYFGTAAISTGSIAFAVVPSSGPQEQAPKPRARARAPKR